MFDLKTINLVIEQLQSEKNISKDKIIEAIEASLATAYKKEYCRKSQYIKCHFDFNLLRNLLLLFQHL
jgi:myo-inositol-1-phosphate synthase